jgi:hypothetical protein
LAQNLDTLQNSTVFPSRVTAKFIADYLQRSEEDFLNPGTCAASRPADIMVAAHMILTHSLLDRLSDALGLQGSTGLQLTPRKPYGDLNSEKFGSIIDCLKNWDSHISRAKGTIEKHMQQGDQCDYPLFNGEVENPTHEQRRLMAAASNLAKGASRLKRVEAAQVMLNLELMAFAIVWYGEVSGRCLFIY